MWIDLHLVVFLLQQADSAHDRDRWIRAISEAIAHVYVTLGFYDLCIASVYHQPSTPLFDPSGLPSCVGMSEIAPAMSNLCGRGPRRQTHWSFRWCSVDSFPRVRRSLLEPRAKISFDSGFLLSKLYLGHDSEPEDEASGEAEGAEGSMDTETATEAN